MDLLPSEILGEICGHLCLDSIVPLSQVCKYTNHNTVDWRLIEWRNILKKDKQELRMCINDEWKDEYYIIHYMSHFKDYVFTLNDSVMMKLVSSYGSHRLIKCEPTLIHYVIKYNKCDYNISADVKELHDLEKIYRREDFSPFFHYGQILDNIMRLVYKHKLYRLFVNIIKYKDVSYKEMTRHTDFAKLFIETKNVMRVGPMLDSAFDNGNVELMEYLIKLGYKYQETQLYKDGKFFSRLCIDPQVRFEKIVEQMFNRMKLTKPTTLCHDFLEGKCFIQDYEIFDRLSHKSMYSNLYHSMYEKYPKLEELVRSKMNILTDDTKQKCRYTQNCPHCTRVLS